MNKLLFCYIIVSFFSSILSASSIPYKPYFVLKDGKVMKIPDIFLLDKKEVHVWLINYNQEKQIAIKNIHRIQKIENKDEAILYMKNNEVYRIIFSFNMILKGDQNPFYRNIPSESNISYERISEIVFN